MLNIGQLTSAVQANCDISDAQFAGNYSLCTFLLKMREYYRWEHDLPLSAALGKDDIGRWLSDREQLWDGLDQTAFHALPIGDRMLDPFDGDAVNTLLIPHGYIYSGGRGLFKKPQFFLGALKQTMVEDGITFHIAGCEYAREISASPAMALGETVFVRQESLRRFIWEKIEEWRWKQNHNAPLARSLSCYATTADLERTLEQMTDNESATLVLHELGEVRAGRILGARWHEMLGRISRSRAEFIARAARDNLADCLVTIPTLAERGNDAALHFYFANFTGLRRELFPEVQNAYLRWIGGGAKQGLLEVCERSAEHWRGILQDMLERFDAAPEHIDDTIESLFKPTGEDAASCAR